MPIREFRVTNFRCLAAVELVLEKKYTVVHGSNASGKTSLLEALAYLGRGKSFRGASTADLVRYGEDEFTLFGRVDTGEAVTTLGVRNGRKGLEVRVDGVGDEGIAALAARLPLQIIDPEVHSLVSGGPENRRRFVDWIAFHVEPGYLQLWRRFRRVFKQRNAALKAGVDAATLESWTEEFATLGERLGEARQRVLERAMPSLEGQGRTLLQAEVGFEYRSGWGQDRTLADALIHNIERDRAAGSCQVGPQRSDVRLVYDERQARRLVSRGQQKLLASAMILAASELVRVELGQPLLLLLDDPGAELDRDSLQRLMEQVVRLDCQTVATSLTPDISLFPDEPGMFHVKRGELTVDR